jgi:hypothetical protein
LFYKCNASLLETFLGEILRSRTRNCIRQRDPRILTAFLSTNRGSWTKETEMLIHIGFHRFYYYHDIMLQHTEERSIPIAVRIHKTLELADDKFYVITCGKAGFKNAK